MMRGECAEQRAASRMRLLRLAEVQIGAQDRVFRHSPAKALIAVGGALCASAGLVWFGWTRGAGLAYYLAGVLVLAVLVLHKLVIARLRPSNWLVRMNDEGLFLQFRSYLNHHFPPEDRTVAFLLYREIRSARMIDERRTVPERDFERPMVERTLEQRRRLVELELAGDLAPLAHALQEERLKRPRNATLYKHYPARMVSAHSLQVEWNVAPGAREFLAALRPHTNVAPPLETAQDYSNLQSLSRTDQERRLLELIDTGQTITAVYLARQLYCLDLTAARDYVEELARTARRS